MMILLIALSAAAAYCYYSYSLGISTATTMTVVEIVNGGVRGGGTKQSAINTRHKGKQSRSNLCIYLFLLISTHLLTFFSVAFSLR